MSAPPPDQPRLPASFFIALVVAVLAVLGLALGSPRMPLPEHVPCRLHLTPMAPGDAPSTWSSWPSSRDITEVLWMDGRLEEPRDHPLRSWEYLGRGSIDQSICPDDARLFSQAARPAGQPPAARVVSDSEATQFLAISAAPEHVVAAFHADWHDDAYERDNHPRILSADDFQAYGRAWIPALVALLLCLLPLAFARRFLDARTYLPGALGADGQLSIVGIDGQQEILAPPPGWRAAGHAGPVLVSLVPPGSPTALPPVSGYREAATGAPPRRARSIALGTREALLRSAERVAKGGLAFVAVACGLAWIIFEVTAVLNDWPNC